MIYDFIIIGSGLAGLNAALEASMQGPVLLITKKKLYQANTFHAQGGIAAVTNTTDKVKSHIEDTFKAGSYHNDRKAVKFIVRQGPQAIERLIKLGVDFSKDPGGHLSLHREGGHLTKRVVHSGDHTGKNVILALIHRVKQQKNIKIYENTFAKDLLVKNKTCYGATIIKNKHTLNVLGRRTVLATGGLGQIYAKTTNPDVATGDGIAMAYRGGCKLKDLEFIQFHPTTLAEKKTPQFLLSEALRGDGAYLTNKDGERFMINQHPLAELAPRDIVSRAIFSEEKKGTIYLDLRHKKASDLDKKFPTISAYLKKHHLNLGENLIPVTPTAHYSCGGIVTDLHGKTSIKNLYAAGEVACTGLHGANRLASNSLLEAAVMSSQITRDPLPKLNDIPNFTPLEQEISSQTGKRLIHIRKNVQRIMWNNVGIIRTPLGLKKAQTQIKSLLSNLPKTASIQKLETENMLLASLLVTEAASKRTKSLGAHFIG